MIFEKNNFEDLRKSSKGFWQVTRIWINYSSLSIWTKVLEKKSFGMKIFAWFGKNLGDGECLAFDKGLWLKNVKIPFWKGFNDESQFLGLVCLPRRVELCCPFYLITLGWLCGQCAYVQYLKIHMLCVVGRGLISYAGYCEVPWMGMSFVKCTDVHEYWA